MVCSGMILIREVADAPIIMGISKPAGLKSPCGEVKIVNPLFVGIDVSSRSNVAYLMKPDGSKHSSFSVQNNLGGAKMLSERIVSALSSMRLSDVVIGLEATSIYGNNLVYALREDGSLSRFQRKIHVLNPKQVKKFKEAYPDLPKNDFVDAFVIADHLRFGRIAKEVYMDDYRYQALRTLTRARFDVIQNLTREKIPKMLWYCSGERHSKHQRHYHCSHGAF